MAEKNKKVSEIKQEMGYHTVTQKCGNCVHFKSEQEPVIGQLRGYGLPGRTKEVNLRCTLGGFAVKKTACCNKHEFNIYM